MQSTKAAWITPGSLHLVTQGGVSDGDSMQSPPGKSPFLSSMDLKEPASLRAPVENPPEKDVQDQVQNEVELDVTNVQINCQRAEKNDA